MTTWTSKMRLWHSLESSRIKANATRYRARLPQTLQRAGTGGVRLPSVINRETCANTQRDEMLIPRRASGTLRSARQ